MQHEERKLDELQDKCKLLSAERDVFESERHKAVERFVKPPVVPAVPKVKATAKAKGV